MRTWFERCRRSSAAAALALAVAFLSGGCDDGNGVGADDPVLGIALVAEGLTAPVTLMESPDETERLFVVDQAGQIRIVAADGTLLPTPFLDLSGSMVALNPDFDERGLLGLAFHPEYATNGRRGRGADRCVRSRVRPGPGRRGVCADVADRDADGHDRPRPPPRPGVTAPG